MISEADIEAFGQFEAQQFTHMTRVLMRHKRMLEGKRKRLITAANKRFRERMTEYDKKECPGVYDAWRETLRGDER